MIWTAIIGAPVALVVWLAVLMNWRRGLSMLLAFVPFAGVVALAMSPNKMGLLVKDLVFVAPLYLAALPYCLRSRSAAPIPRAVLGVLLLLAAMVLVQSFNPNLRNLAMAAIGVKVWLFYPPLLLVAAAAVARGTELVRLLRLVVVVSVIPCGLGLVQFVLSTTMGYQTAMEAMYGSLAGAVTQNFSGFKMGAVLFRIPSTFTFVAQFAGFTLAMVVACYASMRCDPSPSWRGFARFALTLVITAGLLSGSRGNFLFIPLLLGLIYVIDGRITGGLAGMVVFPTFVLGVMSIAGLDPMAVFGQTSQLLGNYGAGLVLPDLMTTLADYPLGQGTGSNTGAARHALAATAARGPTMYEGYYAKAIVEMGWPGLLAIVALFGTLILGGLRTHMTLRDPALRSCSAAFVAFIVLMALNSFKGWQMDLDPVNVYFWIFAGLLFKLPALDARTAPAGRRPRAANRFRQPARPAPAGAVKGSI